MPIWQLCANLLIPNCLRSNLSYSPLAALELYVIDYKTKKLKPKSVSVCDVGDKELYSEELYIVNDGSAWENYYALYLAD